MHESRSEGAMMVLLAQAAAFFRDEELNSESLVMAERSDGQGESLEIQRALEFDDQDRRLGQDTYCLVVTGGPTCYGGVESWRTLPDRVVEIRLSEEAADVLGLHRDITVKMTDDSPPGDELDAGLRRLLEGNPQEGPLPGWES